MMSIEALLDVLLGELQASCSRHDSLDRCSNLLLLMILVTTSLERFLGTLLGDLHDELLATRLACVQ